MRRITRRIGLFGGPGAIVRAAGAGKGKRTQGAPVPEQDAPVPDSRPAIPPGTDRASTDAPQKNFWLRWFGDPKSKPPR
jgi:hypothetical protein